MGLHGLFCGELYGCFELCRALGMRFEELQEAFDFLPTIVLAETRSNCSHADSSL